MIRPTKPRLVVVDDDAGDLKLVERALRALKADVDLVTAADGRETLEVVGPRTPRKQTLMLLDLNLSTGDGRDILRDLGARGRLGSLPVVVFTNSRRPEDIGECYALGAKSFVRKPSTFDELRSTLRTMLHYWFDTVELPENAMSMS